MKALITLLMLTISIPLAYADITLPVSCDNVYKTSINQLKSSDLQINLKGDPYVYFITLYLEPEIAKKYNKIAEPSIIKTVRPNGTFIINNPLLLLTPSGAITSDLPYQTSINSRQLILFIKTKDKALEIAQKVCPQIKPEVFFLYDYLENESTK